MKWIKAYQQDNAVDAMTVLFPQICDHERPLTALFAKQQGAEIIKNRQKKWPELTKDNQSSYFGDAWLNTMSETLDNWQKIDVKEHFLGHGMFTPQFERWREVLGKPLPPIVDLVFWHQPRALHLNIGFENGCLPVSGEQPQTFHPYSVGASSPDWGEPPIKAWFILGKYNEKIGPYRFQLLLLAIARELHLAIGRYLTESGVFVVCKSTPTLSIWEKDDGTKNYYLASMEYDEDAQYKRYIREYLTGIKRETYNGRHVF